MVFVILKIANNLMPVLRTSTRTAYPLTVFFVRSRVKRGEFVRESRLVEKIGHILSCP